jgi:hypothetical protein
LIKLLKNQVKQKILHSRIVFLKRNRKLLYLITNQSKKLLTWIFAKKGMYEEFLLARDILTSTECGEQVSKTKAKTLFGSQRFLCTEIQQFKHKRDNRWESNYPTTIQRIGNVHQKDQSKNNENNCYHTFGLHINQ